MRLKTLVSLLLLGASTLASAKEKIIFWHAMGGNFQPTLNKIVEEYNKSQDKIEVEALYQGSYQEALNKFKSVQGTDKAPALIQLNEISTEYMYNSGAITPMQEFVKKDNYDLTKLEDTLINYYTINGTLYSMPFNSSASILLYNKDAFKEVGLDPEKAPKSYKELAEAAKKLTKGTERYGFAMIMDAWFIEQLLANENTLYVNEENGRAGKSPTAVAYNGEKIKTIFNWLNDMYRDNTATSYGKEYQNTRAAFLSGKVSMYIDSSAGIQQLTELANFEIGSAYVPSENGEFTGVPIGGASLWITNSVSDEKQAAAWDFVKYAVSKESQALWASSTGYYSVNKEAYDLDLLKKDLEKTPQKLVAVNEIKDTQKTAATSGAIVGVFPELRKVMTDSMEKVYVGKEKIDKIIDKMVKESDRIVKRYNRLNSSK
ncbi:MAG: ABC transporter substrate-binding protein [Fusobacterium mortiferum]|jgi:sn-glycerol 3-phosphate transport system substrate-binding protein|uniref:ABC transporter substrate-binding protein n=1 Tax=Fusobacterium mortiferum TaxID=850 RepID=UPI000E4B773D|nr:ABC transporter substrate-binding protein [Fusobacterium mortiferum]MCF2628021.1 ABC transporter substrate-binding protein [Fusobacterium mortiferum]MCF2699632.1 ABC transporter substrate-binding protein [Fusobacterium mortiferum]MDY4801606.1 ABC transporter substrate-binding protein [Fusobacterium mortiferum]RHF64633.1 ABC transporter substrate-binding protein [Fusobacterium mortiferum]